MTDNQILVLICLASLCGVFIFAPFRLRFRPHGNGDRRPEVPIVDPIDGTTAESRLSAVLAHEDAGREANILDRDCATRGHKWIESAHALCGMLGFTHECTRCLKFRGDRLAEIRAAEGAQANAECMARSDPDRLHVCRLYGDGCPDYVARQEQADD